MGLLAYPLLSIPPHFSKTSLEIQLFLILNSIRFLRFFNLEKISLLKNVDEYLGVQINIDHKIELFQDYSINYLTPFKEEGQKVKNILIRFSSLFKNPLKKEKKENV